MNEKEILRVFEETTNGLNFLINALKKQIPQKAEDGVLCPVCSREVVQTVYTGGFRAHDDYCSGCGQAIDWKE